MNLTITTEERELITRIVMLAFRQCLETDAKLYNEGTTVPISAAALI